MLYSITAFATPYSNSANSYHLANVINFRSIQCPLTRRLTEVDHYEANSCNLDVPKHHLYQYYIPYGTIFQKLQPLRPFTFQQQLAMLELFDILGITEHMNDLITMVNLTQNKNLSDLSKKQLEQTAEWRVIEGAPIYETICENNSRCKEEVSTALLKIGLYDTKVPQWRHYDYTIFLGGSIQQMQWRMMMLLSLFQMSLEKEEFDLGELVALTCDRWIDEDETSTSSLITMFNVDYTASGKVKAFIADKQKAILTETTGFQAILYSLQQMSLSEEYFNRFKETSAGYHTAQPISFLAPDSYEKKLYKKSGYTYRLNNRLPKVLKSFFERYPKPVIIETSMQKRGETLIKRPTTKRTVKEWLKRRNNKLVCKNPKHCKILFISNAPNIYYQHIASLQALEESITEVTDLIYEVSTAGPGASIDIPTNAPLDNLTKQLYLEAYTPTD